MACIRYLRKSVPGVKISVEIEKFPREGLQKLVPEADIIFYSKTWAVVFDPFPPRIKIPKVLTRWLTLGKWIQRPQSSSRGASTTRFKCVRSRSLYFVFTLRPALTDLIYSSLLCCTWGADGAAVFEPSTGTYFHKPAWLPPYSSVVE